MGLITFFSQTKRKSQPSSGEAISADIDVHIILGQSNSIGRAEAVNLPSNLQEPLTGCNIFNVSINSFESIKAGVNTRSDAGQFGPVVNASYLLQQHKNKPVYFVVYGVGGTNLYATPSANGTWNVSANTLIKNAKQVIAQAGSTLISEGKNPIFKSIAWWQGESDSDTQAEADAYYQNEIDLVNSLRGISYLADTKWVVYKVFAGSGSFYTTVNSAKEQRANEDSGTIGVIDVSSYSLLGDNIHANAQGQLDAGEDLFNIIKDL